MITIDALTTIFAAVAILAIALRMRVPIAARPIDTSPITASQIAPMLFVTPYARIRIASIAGMIVPATTAISTILVPTAVFPVPAMPALAPIAAIIVTHRVTATTLIEEVEAIAWVPIVVIPAPAITNIRKAVAVVAVVIVVELAIWIAVIIAAAIAVAGIAQANIINAS
jgi:hypothetical protein